MLLKSPYKKTYQNLLLTKQGDLWAFYKLNAEVISTSDIVKKEAYKDKFKDFLYSLKDYQDFHLHMYPRDMMLSERFEQLSKDFDTGNYDIAKYYADKTVVLLNEQLGSFISRNVFVVAVCLNRKLSEEQSTFELFKHQTTNVSEKLVNLLGFELEMTTQFFKKYEEIEHELFSLVSSVSGIRLSEDELNYIQRLSYIGQVPHNIEDEEAKRGATAICDVIIDPTNSSVLKLESEAGIIYKSYIVLDMTPDIINNFNLFEMSQNFNFPIEVHVKSNYKDNGALSRKRQKYLMREKEVAKDEKQSALFISDKRVDNFSQLKELGNQLDKYEVFNEWIAAISVTGSSVQEVKSKVNHIIRKFRRKKYYFVRPVADQLKLFYIFLHGVRLEEQKNWLQLSTIDGISQMLFGVTQSLGTQIGFYIGRIDKYIDSMTRDIAIKSSRDIVLFHPFLANKDNDYVKKLSDSPHISITGKTGSGKSFLMKMLYYISMLLKIKVLYFDPKSEFEIWHNKILSNKENIEKYPAFIKLISQIKYVTLDYTKSSNYGVLDPIVFLKGAEAKDLMKGIFDEVRDFSDKLEIETALLQAIDDVVEARALGEQVGSLHIIELLRTDESDEVRKAGDNLYQKTQNGILKLIFSNGVNDTLSINNKSTILQVLGLDLPSADITKDSYSTSEKNSVALMLIIAKFMEKFGANPKEQTAIFFDEAWLLNTSKIGQKILNSLKRIGRSMNNALIFGSQSVMDTEGQTDHGNFGCIFAFDNDKERPQILRHLGLDDEKQNDINIKLLKGLTKGQCLFRDFYGHVAKLTVHSLFDEWTQALQTVEATASSELENKYSR